MTWILIVLSLITIAVSGVAGTLSEIGLALKVGRVLVVKSMGGVVDDMAGETIEVGK